jgi:hypothetical protein
MKALTSSVEDSGKLPSKKVAEPTDDRQRIAEVSFKLRRGRRLDPVKSVEVENGIGRRDDVACRTRTGAWFPDGWGGHRTDPAANRGPFAARLPVAGVMGLSALMYITGPNDGIRMEQRSEEMTGTSFGEISVNSLGTIIPHILTAPSVAFYKSLAALSDSFSKPPSFQLSMFLQNALLPVAPHARLRHAGGHSGEREYAAVVNLVTGCRHAAVFPARINDEVVTLPITLHFSTSRTSSGDLAGRMLTEVSQPGELQGFWRKAHLRAFRVFSIPSISLGSVDGMETSAQVQKCRAREFPCGISMEAVVENCG